LFDFCSRQRVGSLEGSPGNTIFWYFVYAFVSPRRFRIRRASIARASSESVSHSFVSALARAMESVWCHDCRARVDIDASAFDDSSSASSTLECPACSSVFLERADVPAPTTRDDDDGGQRAFPVLFGTAFVPIIGGHGVFGDIDLTQFDTRNFDSPASASAVEALPERDAREAGATGAGATCSVCLSEYEEEERVKTIPKCGHTFHVNCLMEWLKTVRDLSDRNARTR